MGKNKTFKITIVTVFLVTLCITGCTHYRSVNKVDDRAYASFPTDQYGYPKTNIVLINGEKYEMKSNIDDNASEEEKTTIITIKNFEDTVKTDIVLPKYVLTCKWTMKEKENPSVLYYNIYRASPKEAMDGGSSEIQHFRIIATKGNVAEFKFVEEREMNKHYEDREGSRILKIQFE